MPIPLVPPVIRIVLFFHIHWFPFTLACPKANSTARY